MLRATPASRADPAPEADARGRSCSRRTRSRPDRLSAPAEPDYAWTGYVRAPEPRPRRRDHHASISRSWSSASSPAPRSSSRATRSAGRPPPRPARPVNEEQALRPVLGRLPRHHRALRRRRRRSQDDHRGRDPRHDRVPRRPVFVVPVLGGLPQEPPGHLRPVRGHRRRDVGAQPPRVGGDCTPLGPDCQLVIVKPIEGSPADKAGHRGRRRRDRHRRRHGRGPDGRRRGREGARAQGHDGDADGRSEAPSRPARSRSSAT